METELKISKLWFDEDKIFILTDNDRELWQSLLWYPRLKQATQQQRNNYYLSYSGIHWPDVDEDISFESFLQGNSEPEGISRLFLTYPELNASAIARRLGIQQSLLAAYIRGTKRPSRQRETEIKTAIRQIGAELLEFHIN